MALGAGLIPSDVTKDGTMSIHDHRLEVCVFLCDSLRVLIFNGSTFLVFQDYLMNTEQTGYTTVPFEMIPMCPSSDGTAHTPSPLLQSLLPRASCLCRYFHPCCTIECQSHVLLVHYVLGLEMHGVLVPLVVEADFDNWYRRASGRMALPFFKRPSVSRISIEITTTQNARWEIRWSGRTLV